MNNLSKRLKIIANFVNKGELVADIGSDHGHLPIFLYLNNICPKVVAVDNKIGPYKVLKENVNKSNADVTCLLSNGIDDIPSYINVAVLAGLGAHLIIDILSNEDKRKQLKALIIDSHTELDYLRKNITKLGYKIIKEEMVLDMNKYYTIIRAELGEANYNELDFFFGPLLRINKDEIFISYWRQRLDYLNMLLTKNLSLDKLNEVNKEISLIKEVL